MNNECVTNFEFISHHCLDSYIYRFTPTLLVLFLVAKKGQSKNILQIPRNVSNPNIFLKSLSKILTNL